MARARPRLRRLLPDRRRAARPASTRRRCWARARRRPRVYAALAMPLAARRGGGGGRRRRAPRADPRLASSCPAACDLLDTPSRPRLRPLRRPAPASKVAAPLELGRHRLGAHPALGEGSAAALKGLFDARRLGLLPGIDYADPDLSHFNSRHFWETGIVTDADRPGWLGRWVDRHGGADNPFQGVSVAASSRRCCAARARRWPRSPRPATPGGSRASGTSGPTATAADVRLASARPAAAGPAAVRPPPGRAAGGRRAEALRQGRRHGPDPLAPPVAYPATGDRGGGWPSACRRSPACWRSRSASASRRWRPTATSTPTTTSGPRSPRDLGHLSGALSAFQADLEARGVADRVLTLVWTEFGRRPQENGSSGTDHGAGGIGFVLGTRVRGGLLTPYPTCAAFDRDDNLKVTADFRRGLRRPARGLARHRRRRGAARRRRASGASRWPRDRRRAAARDRRSASACASGR